MSSHRTVDPEGPLRLVLVGAGGMGRAWISAIQRSTDAVLVGIVDLNIAAAQAAIAEAGLDDIAVGQSLSAVAAATDADAVVNVTVPAAHLPVNVEALTAGYPVLCEKPAASTVADALRQAAVAETYGQLLMISQSRRYFDGLHALRRYVTDLGEIGTVSTEFFKAPRFGGFREEMEHVLLVDMAIHSFDTARQLISQNPVAVYAEEYNPGWSWYRGAANAAAVFEFDGGTRYTYTGSWCSPGRETSWNGRWRISGEHGTAEWDGEGTPTAEISGSPVHSSVEASPEEIDGSLKEFLHCLRTGHEPETSASANIHSLAMVEAAVLSATTQTRILITDILSEALQTALASEAQPAVRAALEAWHTSDAATPAIA